MVIFKCVHLKFIIIDHRKKCEFRNCIGGNFSFLCFLLYSSIKFIFIYFSRYCGLFYLISQSKRVKKYTWNIHWYFCCDNCARFEEEKKVIDGKVSSNFFVPLLYRIFHVPYNFILFLSLNSSHYTVAELVVAAKMLQVQSIYVKDLWARYTPFTLV